ncbi:MAG: DNA repair protein RecN [Alloprevotella sp.]|nr:DNA repair protein RecN [Alloprevotella sp.]
MLRHLHIRNYALIESLDIDFERGFSVVTGETGAGKSIILGALGLLLGQRADAKLLKAGTAKCVVEAVFSSEELELGALFKEHDIDYEEEACIIRREITAAGKSRAFINDTPVQLVTLKTIATHLVDIHSQHQNLLLSEEDFLLGTLDRIAGNDTLIADYREAFKAWKNAEAELEALIRQAESDTAELEFVQFQLQQIDAAGLREGETEELEAEAEVLSHAEDIRQALFDAEEILNAEENSLVQQLRSAAQRLEAINEVYPTAGTLAERLESARLELQDIADELGTSLDRIESDPARLTAIGERLDTIYTLQKKHNAGDIAALLALAEDFRLRTDRAENIEIYVQEKSAEVKRLQEQMKAIAERLSQSRKHVAETLEEELTEEVKNLGMPDVSLQFAFAERTAPDMSGTDSLTFFFSAHRDVPMRDVAQIASGGEIARLMLALKAELAKRLHLPTIIFDEIDTGVSGTMAERMARVMGRMAESGQVLCITHLPQIAAAGKQHYRVYKEEEAGRTSTQIRRLSAEERISEVAAMLSGERLTDEAINNAKVLLGT